MTLALDEMRELMRGPDSDSGEARYTIGVCQEPSDEIDPLTIMKNYLLLKFEQGDWHGVSDAAMDIREMLAQEKK